MLQTDVGLLFVIMTSVFLISYSEFFFTTLRWKSLSFFEDSEKEEINTELLHTFWNIWNGDSYLKHLLEGMEESCSPLFSPGKVPKLNEEVGNFMLSLINESDSVEIGNNITINTEVLGIFKSRRGNKVLQRTTACKHQP